MAAGKFREFNIQNLYDFLTLVLKYSNVYFFVLGLFYSAWDILAISSFFLLKVRISFSSFHTLAHGLWEISVQSLRWELPLICCVISNRDTSQRHKPIPISQRLKKYRNPGIFFIVHKKPRFSLHCNLLRIEQNYM